MNRTSKYIRLMFGLMVVTAMLVTAFGGASARADKKILRVGELTGNVNLDPATAEDNASIMLLEPMYVGLTPQDETTAAVVPGLAESWDVSEDGLTYTFHMMQNIPWVRYDPDADQVVQVTDDAGNPRYVTANDIVYAVKRTLDPATASNYAYVLASWVTGGAAYNGGDLTVALGIQALDDWTLEVVSPQAAAFAPLIYGMWIMRPQPQWAIEEYADAWTLPGNFESYGSYTVKELEQGVSVTLVPNPFWPGTPDFPKGKLDEIQITYLDESALLASYEAGEMDWIDTFPSTDIPRLKAERPDEYTVVGQGGTYYYGFNVTKAPFDNVHVRRAFSLAIDRQTLVDKVTQGGQIPAGYFTPPVYGASPIQADYPDTGVGYDPDKAKAELQAYFDETGTTMADLPQITLMFNTSEGHARIAQAIQQMWKDALGIDVQVTNQEWQTYLATLTNDTPQVWRLGWNQDYSDPNNWLNDVFFSESGNNHTHWANPTFDQLVLQAMTEKDNQTRKDLYAQAEQILTWDDCAIAPIYFYTDLDLTQPYVVRTVAITGHQRFDKWDINK